MSEPPEEAAEVVIALPLSRFQVRLAGGELLTAFLHRGIVGRGQPPELEPGTPSKNWEFAELISSSAHRQCAMHSRHGSQYRTDRRCDPGGPILPTCLRSSILQN
jgi:hypothetical protein